MAEHTVASFDEDLRQISQLIRDMGDLAGSMVGASTKALLNSDNALAQRVVSDDAIMDARQRELDDRAITLIAKRQPMADDLRSVVGAIRMAGDLERIGDLAASMVGASARALLETDNALAQRVVSDDAIMDARQRELDDRAITLIAKRQPMADDLRHVVGSIRMAGDLERIGDLAKNIAKRVGSVGVSAAPRDLTHSIDAMAQLVLIQVQGVIQEYTVGDATALAKLRNDDERIDVKYTSVFRELLTYMMEDPRNITACTHLLFCAKNLERIGDHVTNIAENAYYVLTGTQLPANRPKQDETAMSAPAA